MNNRMSLRSLFLFALLVVSGIAGALYLRATLVADDTIRLAPVPDHSALEAQERAKPRFVGEVGGIFLAPQGTPVPEEYTTFEDVCGDTLYTQVVPDERAGALELTLDLPSEYVLVQDVASGVIACGDTVIGMNLVYDGPAQPTGIVPYVTISRSIVDHDEIDAATERIQLRNISGRDVIVMEPLTKDGYGQWGRAWISEPFGFTVVHTVDLPRDEFLKLVELVASSTRTQ